MPTYRIKKAGHFMGKYYAEGTELNMHEKQAKYALLSGQLEPVGYVPPKAKPKAATGPITPTEPPKPPFKKRRSIGGSSYRGER